MGGGACIHTLPPPTRCETIVVTIKKNNSRGRFVFAARWDNSDQSVGILEVHYLVCRG